MRPRAALALLALLALLLAAALPAQPAPPDGMGKAEPALQAAVLRGGSVTLVVQGPDLPAPASVPADRAAWRAHWAQASAPFLRELRQRVAELGGEVLGATEPVDAAHVRMDASGVPALLALPGIARAGLDAPGSVRVAASLAQAASLEQVPDVTSLGYDGTGVALAMVDTGVRPTHEMLVDAQGATRVAQWKDLTTDPNGTGYCRTPCDANGHGTHTASTALGSHRTNPNAPVGMAPGATLLAERIFQGDSGTWQAAQDGLQAAFDAGADVTSDSWGGTCDTDGDLTARLVQNLSRAGMVNVFAAGNDGPTPGSVTCPGVAPGAITVGAVGLDAVIAGFSGRGPCAWDGATRACPDVTAMGVGLDAAWNGCDTCYQALSGTSMATPQVAGIVALLEQAARAEQGRSLAPSEPELLLRYSAMDLGAPGPDDAYGWGLAQAKAALDLLRGEGAGRVLDRSANPVLLHGRDSATLLFAAANLGPVPVHATLTHVAEQLDTGLCPPACERVVVAQRDLDLGAWGEVQSAYAFRAAEHAAGTWRVAARLDWNWTDAQGPHNASVQRASTFVVKKVDLRLQRLVPLASRAGALLDGGLRLVNLGNDDAGSVRLDDRFDPLGFAPVPLVPPGALPYGALADPAPGAVRLDPPSVAGGPFSGVRVGEPGVHYAWSIGSLPAGQAWSARAQLLAAAPGNYTFDAGLTFTDSAGMPYARTLSDARSVLPAVDLPALPG